MTDHIGPEYAQRLRGIRQLGFSYLTYPSAEHSRFIHSLGMYAVVSRFLDSMKRSRERLQIEGITVFEVDDDLRLDLLHAAILHDVGHMPFSHASEAVLENFPVQFRCGPWPIRDFLFDAADALALPKEIKLSEALSIAIILSPRFETFYTRHVRPGVSDSDHVLRLGALVAGLRPEPKLRGAAELISNSPVDADKVDYINRDALGCGIPVGIDVARLFLRSAFLDVRAERLNALLAGRESIEDDEVIFVVNASGVDTIEELVTARASLYQRVYLHQTTRNAERLLGRALEALGPPAEESLRDALELLSLDDSALIRRLTTHPTTETRHLAARLRNRDLPKRACVFGRTMVDLRMPIEEVLPKAPKENITKHALGFPLQRLRREELGGEHLGRLELEIAREATDLAKRLEGNFPDLVPMGPRAPFVTILPMAIPHGLKRDCIVLENNELLHSSRRTISDELGDAADIYKSLGYVLTDHEWREFVFLAARKVIAREFAESRKPMQVQLLPDDPAARVEIHCAGRIVVDRQASARRAGLNTGRLAEIERAANQGGFFNGMPWLVPQPASETRRLAERLSSFEGQGGWSVTAASCAAFLSQFPWKLRDEMLRVLEGNLLVIDRATIRGSLSVAAQRCAGETTGAVWIAALTPDSGNFVRMVLEHEAREQLKSHRCTFAKSVEEALQEMGDDDFLLLCDDNISSGSQASCQFWEWFGVERTEWPEGERKEEGVFKAVLPRELQEKLRRVRFRLAFCLGSKLAETNVRTRLEKVGVRGFQGIEIGRDISRSPPSMSNDLRSFLAQVGADLLAFCRHGEDRGASALAPPLRESCSNDALGYGGARAMITTVLSVPTATVTSLWCPGMFNGDPWIPLLLRRGYLKHLVVT